MKEIMKNNNKNIFQLLILILCFSKIYSSDWEDIDLICPNQCVCQHSHFMDLSIARWVNSYETIVSGEYFDTIPNPNQHEDLENDNEVLYDNDRSHENNPLIKFAYCLLQSDTNVKILISSIPQDVQALILLHTGAENNFTIYTSDISSLPELEILEIRGDSDMGIHLIIDEPLPNIKHVNFELIRITSSETLKRRTNMIDPSEHFDYVPFSEKLEYNVTLEIEEEVEIVPYEVYIMAIRKSRLLSFYGWLQLNVLRIHECKLNELEWEIFDGLDKLQHLSLENNNIKIIPPFSFHGVPHIKSLSLARNNITDLNYRALAGLLDLVSLDLSHNQLNKLSELTFPPFPKLKYIDLRQNPIKNIYPSTFGIMNNTRVLHLGDKETELELFDKETFQSLYHLKFLSIYNLRIDHLTQSLFEGLNNLQTLKLQGNIKYIDYDAFCDLPKLKELILNNCKIEALSMDALFGLHELEIVDLSNNELRSLPPGIFDDKKTLKEIYLQNNFLTELPNNFFNGIYAKLIRLTGNPWYCTCEMLYWKQGITNKIRGSKIRSNCMHTTKQRNCGPYNRNYNYIFDNKMSPKCEGGPDDVLNRSIYYVIRRNFNCNTTKILQEKMYNQSKINEQKTNRKILKSKPIKFDDRKLNTIVKIDKEKYNNNLNKIEPYLNDVKLERQRHFNNKYLNTINNENNIYSKSKLMNPTKYLDRKYHFDEQNDLPNLL